MFFFFKRQHGIECVKFLTRSIGLSNRITNSPDHRLASRKFLSFWPGSRTFPITDCHLDHCMERWNERIGMRKRSVSYQPPGKQTTDSCTHFFAKLSSASHSYFELPQGGNCPEYDFASFQSTSRSKSFRSGNRLKPLSSSTSATKFFKPCIQSLNVAADCELFLALCSYILWCISKKFHSQWELLWQSMFSVDIEDIKLVHLDFPSHPSHCAIDFDLWTSFRFCYFHFVLCTCSIFFQNAAWHWMRETPNAKHWPFEPDHEQSRSPTCISKILVLLTRITNIPDHRLSSGPLYGKVKRTHWDEEAISLISATSWKSFDSIERKLL